MFDLFIWSALMLLVQHQERHLPCGSCGQYWGYHAEHTEWKTNSSSITRFHFLFNWPLFELLRLHWVPQKLCKNCWRIAREHIFTMMLLVAAVATGLATGAGKDSWQQQSDVASGTPWLWISSCGLWHCSWHVTTCVCFIPALWYEP